MRMVKLNWFHGYNEDNVAATINFTLTVSNCYRRHIKYPNVSYGLTHTPVLSKVKEDENLAPAFDLCSSLFFCTKPRWNRLTNYNSGLESFPFLQAASTIQKGRFFLNQI